MDTDKRYFSGLEVHEIYECKVLNKDLKMCRQNKPLQLAYLEEICEAQMARPIRSIPPSCSQRIVELNHTLWQQLHENEWLFVAPALEVLTVLCDKREPTDVTLSGTGRLRMEPRCKAYGSRVLIQSHVTVSNHTGKDVIPPLSLGYDCCGSVDKKFKLNRLRLQVSLGGVAGSLDDVKIANHKTEDTERLIYEQDWKAKHFAVDTSMSLLSYVGMTTMLTLICSCYWCLKCCCRRCFKFSKWWKDNKPCATIVFNPRIVTSIRSSGENVRGSEPRASGRNRRSLTEAAIISNFACLDTDSKRTMATLINFQK